MSKKDTITKKYMNNNTVFSDILNLAVFHGEQRIKPEFLHEMDPVETVIPTGATGKTLSVQKIRDLLKVCESEEILTLITAIESQAEVHYAMPVRCMTYDALRYSNQVAAAAKSHRTEKEKQNRSESERSVEKAETSVSTSADHTYTKEKNETGRLQDVTRQEFLSGFFRTDKLLPVLTIVVYFGSDPWDGPRTLHEMFPDVSQEVLKYIPDYRLNILIPAEMSDEEIHLFQSGMREVFLFIKYAKEKDRLSEILRKDFRTSQLDYETALLISTVTGTKIKFKRKDTVNMCKAIDDMIQDGREEGREEGRTSLLVNQIITKLKKQLSAAQIADHLEENVSRIQQIMDIAARYAPDYQVDLIVREILKTA